MKYIFSLISILVIKAVNAQLFTPTDPHWVQQWNDNFTTMQMGTLDACWVRTNNFHHHADEPQINMSNNITLSATNGLVLKAKKEEYIYPATNGINYHYTGSSMSSYNGVVGDRTIQYGYLQADIKISNHYGTWPGFWLWTEPSICSGDGSYTINNGNPGPHLCNNGPAGICPSGSGTPTCDYEEIDIFEIIPGSVESRPSPINCFIHDKNTMTSNIHTRGSGPDEGYYLTSTINDFTNWHTYALEWNPVSINIYVDNIPIRTIPNPGITHKTSIILTQGLNQYVNPNGSSGQYNMAWPQSTANNYFNPPSGQGCIGGPTYPFYNNINTSDAEMCVKNMVYYKLNQSCPVNTVINLPTINWATYIYNVKKSITIGLGTNSVPTSTVNNANKKTLRATDFIEIKGDFTVPLGSELHLEVAPCTQ